MKSHSPHPAAMAKSGTIHVIVLMASLIVAVIGLSSLQLLRLQARTSAGNQDVAAARFHARAALELGFLKVRNDPYWRKNLGNGNWLSDIPMGSGSATLSAVDPIDGDVTKGDNHPVVLTGTGKQGSAVFLTSVRLEVGPPKNSCLEVSMTGGTEINVSGATLIGDQIACSNDRFRAISGAQVDVGVEAFGNIIGGSYGKTQTQIASPRTLPDSTTVFDYYLANGTTISYSSLPTWPQSQLVTNTSFESNLNGWSAQGTCTMTRTNTTLVSGSWSMSVSARASSSSVAVHSFPFSALRSGDTYLLSMPIHSSACSAQAVLTLTSTGEGTQSWSTPLVSVPNNTWTTLSGNITPTWTGTLTSAQVTVSLDTSSDYYTDAVSLTNVTYPAGYYVLDGLITPSSNPYGAANPKGIYIINCSGRKVLVGRSRIVGTLVFINPHSDTSIVGPTIWEPAIENYPALLSNASINIATTSPGFNEADFGANLNPPGAPYPYNGGVANTSLTDSYPSRINGLIYSADDLNFFFTPSISGVVVAKGEIQISASTLTLNYSHHYLNDAPPGFESAAITMKVVPGTWRRKVN